MLFNKHLIPTRQTDWVVYAKRPFSGPEAVLAYLSQYAHRVAISNRRLISYDQHYPLYKTTFFGPARVADGHHRCGSRIRIRDCNL